MIRIGEIAERTGLTPRTIRYYEEIGLLDPSKRRKASTGCTTTRTSSGCRNSGACATC